MILTPDQKWALAIDNPIPKVQQVSDISGTMSRYLSLTKKNPKVWQNESRLDSLKIPSFEAEK